MAIENKTHYIGARFTTKERDYINDFADKYSKTLSTLLREALFSHINFLKQFERKMTKIEVYLIDA